MKIDSIDNLKEIDDPDIIYADIRKTKKGKKYIIGTIGKNIAPINNKTSNAIKKQITNLEAIIISEAKTDQEIKEIIIKIFSGWKPKRGK